MPKGLQFILKVQTLNLNFFWKYRESILKKKKDDFLQC